MLSDFKMEDTLDIAVDLFAFVGGRTNFINACGVTSDDVNETMFTDKAKRVLEVNFYVVAGCN